MNGDLIFGPRNGFLVLFRCGIGTGFEVFEKHGFVFFLKFKSDLNWMLTVSYQLFCPVLFCVSKNSMGTGSDLHNQNWNLNWNFFF
jgi:hypothetical protein